jgi:DNA-binding transcriptional LysR family regulator
VPAAARSRDGRASGYPYLQPPVRGTTVGDYSLAQALAAAGLGIAWGTHLPSAHDLASWRGLAAETEDYARRLLALR